MPQTRDTNGLGEQLQTMYDACLQGFASASPGLGPLLTACARGNQEYMALMSRRARSYLELPERLSNCRTPQDLMTEQTHFWVTLCHDYAEGAQKMTQTWASMMQQGLAAGGQGLTEPARSLAEPGKERREFSDRDSDRRVA